MTVPTGVTGTPMLTWRVTGVEPERMTAVPTLLFRLEVGCPTGEDIQCVVLNVSVRIAVALRDYDQPTRERLRGVFGTAEQWRESLHDIVWARPTVQVPRFNGQVHVDLPVPCLQDMDLAAVSYLHALDDGDVPLRFLFSGTVFHGKAGMLRTAQIPWEGEASYRMPAEIWQRLRARYFGDSRWLRLDEQTVSRLSEYRAARAFPSMNAALEALLDESGIDNSRSTNP